MNESVTISISSRINETYERKSRNLSKGNPELFQVMAKDNLNGYNIIFFDHKKKCSECHSDYFHL